MKNLRGWMQLAGVLMALIGLSGGARAASVTFGWRANTEPALAGYRLYFGPAPGTYTNHIDLGLVTSHRMSNLVAGAIYYFALSAVDTNDLESDLTPEVQFPSPPGLAAIGNQSTPEDTSLNVNLQVSDADTPLASLSLSATSTNLALVPIANISFSRSGSNRTMLITPVSNQSGTTRITVTVSDGSLTSSRNFILTVSGTPDAPTITGLTDVATDEDVQSGTMTFTVNDPDTAASSLTVRSSSSDSVLIPTNRITLGGTGNSRTVSLRPATNRFGSASITLTVSDGTSSSSANFNFTVREVNDLPTMTPISDVTIAEDTATSALAFTINDVETAAGSLQVTGSSSNPGIIPDQNIYLNGGTGTNRTVVVQPATNAVGSAVITLRVSDGQAIASETFSVNVTNVNDGPYVSQPADLIVNRLDPVPPVSFTIWDAETPASSLNILLGSTNQTLLPLTNIVMSGTGTNRTLTMTPVGMGTTRVGIHVSDGLITNRVFFWLTVNGTAAVPTISGTTDVATDEDVQTGVIAFTVNDLDTPATDLTVRATTTNPSLIPTNRITLAGTGNLRTMTLRPLTNQSGSASITLTVSDGTLSSGTNFTFTVRAVNDLPTITAINDVTVAEETQTSAFSFTINDIEAAPASLQVTGSSSNPALVPDQNIYLNGGTGTNRTVSVRPATNAVGTTVITLSVSDGQATASETFTLNVTNVNDLPYVSQPADLTVNKFSPVPPVSFTVWDVETSVSSLNIVFGSTNQTLLPVTNIVMEGTGTNRTLTFTPVGIGMTRVGIHVSDGAATNRVFFCLTITGSNNPPVLTVPSALVGRSGAAVDLVGISVEDADVKTNNMNFTITAPNGTLSVATSVSGGVRGAQVSGNNSGSITIIAPLAALNATFADSSGISYRSRNDFRGTETLVLSVSDNGFTGQGGVGTDTKNIVIDVRGTNGRQAWREAHFTQADLQDPAKEATVWGDLADPDNDGKKNLMEYACGLNPLGSEPQEPALLTQIVNSGGNLHQTLSFDARINEPELQYIPEVSADNATWSAAAVLILSTPLNADFQRLTYRDPVAITSEGARFFRLRIVGNNP